jgi:hypothetical protein
MTLTIRDLQDLPDLNDAAAGAWTNLFFRESGMGKPSDWTLNS